MIVMRVREGDHIEALDSARPEIRPHPLLAPVEPGTLTTDPFRSWLPATVNQHRPAIRKRGEYRVALPNIEHAHFQLAAIQDGCEGVGRYERRQCGERNVGRPFQRSNRRRELATGKATGSESHYSARSNGNANECNEKGGDEPDRRTRNAIRHARPCTDPLHDSKKPCRKKAKHAREQ